MDTRSETELVNFIRNYVSTETSVPGVTPFNPAAPPKLPAVVPPQNVQTRQNVVYLRRDGGSSSHDATLVSIVIGATEKHITVYEESNAFSPREHVAPTIRQKLQLLCAEVERRMNYTTSYVERWTTPRGIAGGPA